MTDYESTGMDSTLLQWRASGTDEIVSKASSPMANEGDDNTELEKASRQFESLLLHFMIREMRATAPESGFLPSSMAQDIFTSMLDEQYAGTMADNGGIGLSRILIDQLSEGQTDK